MHGNVVNQDNWCYHDAESFNIGLASWCACFELRAPQMQYITYGMYLRPITSVSPDPQSQNSISGKCESHQTKTAP